jgi:hypothetical protein
MSEQQQNDSGNLTSMHISDYSEMMAQNKVESENREATAHQVRQAAYDYLDAGNAYGGGRTVYAPEGKVEHAHFRYAPRPKVSKSSFRGRGHKNHHAPVRYYSDTMQGSWQTKSSAPADLLMGDCIPTGWWSRFWGRVGSLLGGRG